MPTPRAHSPFRTRPPARGSVAYEVRASGGTDAEILLYDEIGGMGVTARDFVRDLHRITASTIQLRINSPGGNVFDGVAIAAALREHHARVITRIDGVAASISSLIALAGDEVHMGQSAFFMIHEPFALTMGTAADLRAIAGTLDKVGQNIEDEYIARTGATSQQVREWMAAETWFSAQEAIDAGFADSIISVERETKFAASFDLSVFQHAPDALKNQYAEPPRTRQTDQPRVQAATDKRDIERALRDAGFSRSDATAIAARGFPALSQREAADAPDSATVAALDRLLAALQPA